VEKYVEKIFEILPWVEIKHKLVDETLGKSINLPPHQHTQIQFPFVESPLNAWHFEILDKIRIDEHYYFGGFPSNE
jgi:hypothetical protein